MKYQGLAASAAAILVFSYGPASAERVTSLDPDSAFQRTLIVDGGTAEIVSTVGAGGDLENNAPAPGGALQLVTSATNASRAQVGRAGNYGTVGDLFVDSIGFSYSWFNEVGSGTTGAPALKLEMLNAGFSGDGYGELIYEPYTQGNGANTIVLPEGEWVTETISLTEGRFWDTGFFGSTNQFGGPPYQTLAEYLLDADIDQAGFSAATLVNVSLGLGSYNPSVSSYVDEVTISGTALDGSFDFETAATIPVPAALPLLASAVALLGFAARRRRRA